MTNEERRELVAKLRWYGDRMERELSSPMREAADEIERLAAENGRLTQALIDNYAAPFFARGKM